MKLSDIMSASGLSTYAEVALVIFLLAFLGVVVSLFLPSRQRTYERLRHLPMDQDTGVGAALYRDDDDSSTRASPSLGMTPAEDSSTSRPDGRSARNDDHDSAGAERPLRSE